MKTIPNEQAFYDSLKTVSSSELKDRVMVLFRSVANKEREITMIRNILINRGESVVREVPVNRFVKNTPDENRRYGIK